MTEAGGHGHHNSNSCDSHDQDTLSDELVKLKKENSVQASRIEDLSKELSKVEERLQVRMEFEREKHRKVLRDVTEQRDRLLERFYTEECTLETR